MYQQLGVGNAYKQKTELNIVLLHYVLWEYNLKIAISISFGNFILLILVTIIFFIPQNVSEVELGTILFFVCRRFRPLVVDTFIM